MVQTREKIQTALDDGAGARCGQARARPRSLLLGAGSEALDGNPRRRSCVRARDREEALGG